MAEATFLGLAGFEWGLPWAALAWPLILLVRQRQQELTNSAEAALRLPLTGWQQLPAQLRRQRRQTLPRLWWLVWTLLILAAMQPRQVGEPLQEPRSGRELMLAVDISGSMEATDLPLNDRPATRLQVLQTLMGEFIERRVGDRIGMVLFGERAYLQAPLTFDRATVAQFLREAEIGLAGARRTAIGDGLGLALKHLRDSTAEQRTVLLITDGANNSGALNPEQALALALEMGVRVYTIGVGAEAMEVRDGLFGTRQVNPSAELDEDLLITIAQQTGGRYFRARDAREMAQIYAEMDALEPAISDADIVRPTRELAHWPAAAALLLAGLWLWPRRRTLRPEAGAPTPLPASVPVSAQVEARADRDAESGSRAA